MEPLLKQFADRYKAGGATSSEAQCIAETLLSQNPSALSDVSGNARSKSRAISALLVREASRCASSDRLKELTFSTFVKPYLEALTTAGATRSQADCMVTKIENLDVFFPSEDFNGPRAGQMAGDRFVDNAPGCAPTNQLRQIAKELFAEYQKGCERTSDDPMAPYEC
ncbi:MAG: hypothetical protein QOG04_2201 [Actinomycetota bacterium]|nr:hypothetical protein [Actinomycetota bacterium]